jgi:DNA-binding NarL/FixJ family response regulator
LAEAVKQTGDDENFLSARLTKYLIKEKKNKENAEKTVKETVELSDREYEVYLLLRQKKKGKEIADELCISFDTFKTHRRHLRKKLKKHKLLYLLDKKDKWEV